MIHLFLQVKTWFQNRRMKQKKVQRKNQDDSTDTQSLNGDEMAGNPDQPHSPSDALSDAGSDYSDSCTPHGLNLSTHAPHHRDDIDNEEIDVVSDHVTDYSTSSRGARPWHWQVLKYLDWMCSIQAPPILHNQLQS